MKFSAGDMVTVNLVDVIDLYDEQFGPNEQARAVSRLTSADTAVVVSLSSHDGRCVYIIGPHGAGWTFGAFLKRVK